VTVVVAAVTVAVADVAVVVAAVTVVGQVSVILCYMVELEHRILHPYFFHVYTEILMKLVINLCLSLYTRSRVTECVLYVGLVAGPNY